MAPISDFGRSRGPGRGSTYGHAASGDGCAQRHARTRSPTAGSISTPSGPWPTVSTWRAEGADVVDVGGESSRPGAEPVSEAEELRRVVPVIEALAPHVRVSVDTVKRAVAEAARGGRGDACSTTSRPSLWPVAAPRRGGVGGHAHAGRRRARCRTTPATTTSWPRCAPSCGTGRGGRATAGWARCGWTPGSASARPRSTTWPCCATSPSSWPQGFPVLVGTSRKSFLGRLAAGARRPSPRPVDGPPAGIAGHRHLGHAGGRVDGPGPRRGRCGAGGHAGGRHAPRPRWSRWSERWTGDGAPSRRSGSGSVRDDG